MPTTLGLVIVKLMIVARGERISAMHLCRMGSAVCAEALSGALQFVHSVHQGATLMTRASFYN